MPIPSLRPFILLNPVFSLLNVQVISLSASANAFRRTSNTFSPSRNVIVELNISSLFAGSGIIQLLPLSLYIPLLAVLLRTLTLTLIGGTLGIGFGVNLNFAVLPCPQSYLYVTLSFPSSTVKIFPVTTPPLKLLALLISKSLDKEVKSKVLSLLIKISLLLDPASKSLILLLNLRSIEVS